MSDLWEYPSGIACKTSDRKSCDEAAMVLEAVGIDSQVLYFEGEYLLIVRPEDESDSREQLELYHLENKAKKESVPLFPPLFAGIHGTILYITILILVDGLIKTKITGNSILEAGKANAGLICSGEWWRAVTALTLHADIVHLSGNIVFGALFSLFACQALGTGIGWFTILIAGALGNIISACLQTEGYTSIGASTAVFAALGIQSAYTCVYWYQLSQNKTRRWLPIAGGIVLLAFLGGPGPRIDVLSHVTGFLSGLILGTLFGLSGEKIIKNKRWQAICGTFAILIVAISWFLAVDSLPQ